MVRILVVPERLYELGRQMSQAANDLRSLDGHLGRVLGGMDWQVRQQANIEGQVQAARSQARALAERAEAMARFLSERAQAFQEADSRSAQDLDAAVRGLLTAIRGLFPQASLILSYMTAGRTNMQRFLDLLGIRRYGPFAPWLKIGVLDQRYKLSRTLSKVGVGVGIVSDILTADRIDEETVSVAVIRNIGEYGLGSMIPPVGIVLAGNALFQLTGAGIVMISRLTTPVLATSQAMAEDLNTSADRLEAALKRVDLGRITKDISEVVYDLTLKPRFDAIKAAWEHPNLKNLASLTMALGSPTPPPSPESLKEAGRDTKKLVSDLFDFTLGIPDLAFSLASHTAATGVAFVSKVSTTLPLPAEWKDAVTQSCEQVIDRLVPHPVRTESIWQNLEMLLPSSPPGEPTPLSWANSLQFTPVTVKA